MLGGAIGVGLGFGLQKIAANYISGFVILAERSLRIGDMVKVDNFEGRITDIRTRYTVIRSLGGREAIVPNETLITTRVENASLADPRVLVTSAVQVAYGTDVRALQPKLEEAIRAVARVIADPAPSVQLAAFSADGMDLLVNFWIRDPENGQGNVKSEVNLDGARGARPRRHRDPVPAARRARGGLARAERSARRSHGVGGRQGAAELTPRRLRQLAGSERRYVYSARTSTSLISFSETNGITALTALPSGRLPVFSIAMNCSALG